mmetsp:Transcript_40316/g.64916  ORF Transcript_40316/g.64916 Transcript_40316/m.64916 type:complete len:278 (+) Transcript_40316:133-966(+)
MRLSELLCQRPGCFEVRRDGTLRCGYCNVSLVDVGYLHERYRMVCRVYLCGNGIEQLGWVKGFVCIRDLSVKDNMIRRFKEVEKLKEVGSLVQLNIGGNPVTDYPYFKNHVWHTLKRLKLLDGETCSTGECSINREQSLIALLVDDWVLFNRLDFVFRLFCCHLELVGYVGDLGRLLDIWVFEFDIELVRDEILQCVMQAGRSEILLGRQGWERKAFDRVALQFKARISRLLVLCDRFAEFPRRPAELGQLQEKQTIVRQNRVIGDLLFVLSSVMNR